MEAFSLSKDMLDEAKRKAAERGMTKSGFFRYCLAKELGYSDADALDIAAHRAVADLRQKVEHSIAKDASKLPKLAGVSSSTAGASRIGAAIASAIVGSGDQGSRPSSEAGAPSARKGRPNQSTAKQSSGRPESQEAVPRRLSVERKK